MTIVPEPNPPAAPNKAQSLAKLTEGLPPCDGYVVGVYTEHVHIECEALSVLAVERARSARRYQLELLSLITKSARDRERHAHAPGEAAEVDRVLTDYRTELVGFVQRSLFSLAHGSHDGLPPWLD